MTRRFIRILVTRPAPIEMPMADKLAWLVACFVMGFWLTLAATGAV